MERIDGLAIASLLSWVGMTRALWGAILGGDPQTAVMRTTPLLFALLTMNGPVAAQQLVEGGMRFYRTNRDVILMRSSATSGLQAAGSAAVPGGEINVGSSSSDVDATLNPITNADGSTGDLRIAGEQRQWASALSIQRSAPSNTRELTSLAVKRGNINDDLKQLLISQPALVEEIIKDNPEDASKPFRNVQFTQAYENLVSMLEAKPLDVNKLAARPSSKACQELQNCGTHIIQLEDSALPNPANPAAKPIVGPVTFKAWNNGAEINARPLFTPYRKAVSSDDVINIENLQSSGTNQVANRVTIVGYSRSLDPMAGKSSAISAFATNNKTVGSIRVQPGDTLESIAAKYGVSVKQLMQVNNLPNASLDISGVNLVVPADLSTVGEITVLEGGETPTQIAKRYGISVPWLLELNGLTDSEQLLRAGTLLQIPGVRPLGSPLLPAAKPLASNLETLDYGAYTAYSVTYHVDGSLTPLFTQTLFNTLR